MHVKLLVWCAWHTQVLKKNGSCHRVREEHTGQGWMGLGGVERKDRHEHRHEGAQVSIYIPRDREGHCFAKGTFNPGAEWCGAKWGAPVSLEPYSLPFHSAPASLVLKHSRDVPASGPLHLLFPLPGTLSPPHPQIFLQLSLNITS